MASVLRSRTLSVSIERPPEQVYRFVSDPANLPKWATAFCLSVSKSEGEWVVETPNGPVGIRFAEPNEWGVLDHTVTVSPGVEIRVPMRVIPNGSGSEVLFTLFQMPEMSDAQFAEDTGMVERDLGTLKNVLEG